MSPAGIPAHYHCSVSGVTFPTLYKITHPPRARGLTGVNPSAEQIHEYNLEPASQFDMSSKSPKPQVEEVRRLGPGGGVDLHLTHFDSEDKAQGYIHAIKYMNPKPTYPSLLSNQEGFFVLVAEKSDTTKNRVFFNVFRDAFTIPCQTVFNQNGECVGHPSDC